MSNKQLGKLASLASLASQLPNGLRSDWKDTNHFALTCNSTEYFWLQVSDGLSVRQNPMDSIIGKRFGLLMDLAEEVGRLRDEGFFAQLTEPAEK